MKSLTLIITSLFLTACFEVEEPKTVAQRYWQAMIDKDYETARSLVSTDSQQAFESHTEAVNSPEALRQVALDDQRIVVVSTINPDTDKPWRDRPFETVMVLENGVWRIDLGETRLPTPATPLERQIEDMANDLDGTVNENMKTMEDMLDEGMKLFDQSLENGSREMSESFSRAMRKMQDAMRDSIEQMKQRRQELEQEQQAPAKPDPESGEGVI